MADRLQELRHLKPSRASRQPVPAAALTEVTGKVTQGVRCARYHPAWRERRPWQDSCTGACAASPAVAVSEGGPYRPAGGPVRAGRAAALPAVSRRGAGGAAPLTHGPGAGDVCPPRAPAVTPAPPAAGYPHAAVGSARHDDK